MSEFLDFCQSQGLLVDHIEADGRWHRVPTSAHPRKKNGAYALSGRYGAVIDFATMSEHATWFDGKGGVADRAEITRLLAKARADEERAQAKARELAADMMKRASYDTHPYLAKKGFPQEKGFVLDGELLIPMREWPKCGVVNSLQRINADGKKLFLAGGKAKNSALKLGHGFETWLCEGYATALSVLAALKELRRQATVLVCFSSGNLAKIGQRIKARGWKDCYVMADNDPESKAGEKAAVETGLPWVMPQLVKDGEKTDANDLHKDYGVRAVAGLMRGVLIA